MIGINITKNAADKQNIKIKINVNIIFFFQLGVLSDSIRAFYHIIGGFAAKYAIDFRAAGVYY